MTDIHAVPSRNLAALFLAVVALADAPAHRHANDPAAVSAKLSEWKVELSERTVAAGRVTFTIANLGSIPHALKVEGQGIEQARHLRGVLPCGRRLTQEAGDGDAPDGRGWRRLRDA
jgi:uncharacterized protein involved in outer membrane biogenesis